MTDYRSPLGHAREGLDALKKALEHFKASDNRNTAARVRAAISSAKGAIRIQEMRGPTGGKTGDRAPVTTSKESVL